MGEQFREDADRARAEPSGAPPAPDAASTDIDVGSGAYEDLQPGQRRVRLRAAGGRGTREAQLIRALERGVGNQAVMRLLRQVAPPGVAGRASEQGAGRSLLLPDDAGPTSGAMPRSVFLDALHDSLCALAEAELPGLYRPAGCPWIEHWIDYYRDRSPAEIEDAIARYAPGARSAASATEYIEAIGDRVREGIAAWRANGTIPALPADSPGTPPGEPTPAPRPSGGALARLARAPAEAALSARSELGAGRRIDGGLAARMGEALGADLRDVRIHTGPAAARVAASHRARALAVGRDVVFAPDQYAPGTLIGDALIAHELAHVAQQSGADGPQTSDTVTLEHDAGEAAAVALTALWGGGATVARRLRTGIGPTLRSGLSLQRCPGTPTSTYDPGAVYARAPAPTREQFTPGNVPGATPESILGPNNATTFRFDGDGDEMKELEATMTPRDHWPSGAVRTMHIVVTQISSRQSRAIDIALPDSPAGGGPEWPIVRKVTDGRNPTEVNLVLPMGQQRLFVEPGRSTSSETRYGVELASRPVSPDPDSAPATIGQRHELVFPRETTAVRPVFSEVDPNLAPDAPKPPTGIQQTADIYSLDITIGAYGDRFRLSFHKPDAAAGAVVFGLAVLEDGEPVAGKRANIAVGGPLRPQILPTDGIRLALDLNGDGKEDLALYDRLTAPSSANGGVPSEDRDHDILAVGPSLASPVTFGFAVHNGLITAGSTHPLADEMAAASDVRAVTGLRQQRELTQHDREPRPTGPDGLPEQRAVEAEQSLTERTLGSLRAQALEDKLISKGLFDAWFEASIDFAALRAQERMALSEEFKKEVVDFRNDLLKSFETFWKAFSAETASATVGRGANQSNAYTGVSTASGKGYSVHKDPSNDLRAALASRRWTEAGKIWRRIVDGLDRWIAKKNRDRYGKPDPLHPETNRANYGELLSGVRHELDEIEGYDPRRVSAVLHPAAEYEESGRITDVPLSLYYWKSNDTWHIRDLTRPGDTPTWHLPNAGAATEPPDTLFQRLDEGPHFPRGIIHYELPSGHGGQVLTTGPGRWRTILTYIGLAAAAIGVGLVTFGTGTVAVAGAWVLAGSALVGGAMAGYDLYEGYKHDQLTAGRVILDLGQIVGALAGTGALAAGRILTGVRTAAAAGEVLPATSLIKAAGSVYIPLRAANVASDVVQMAVMTPELAKAYDAVDQMPGDDGSRRRAKLAILAQFALTHGLTALSIKGAIPELSTGRTISIEVVNGIEYAVPVGQSIQGKTITQVRAALEAGAPETAGARRAGYLETIRTQIPGAAGDALADAELMALRPSNEGALTVDAAGTVSRSGTPAGSLNDLLAKVTRANNAAAAHGIPTEYVVRVQPRGADGRSAVQIVAEPRPGLTQGATPAQVSEAVVRQYLAAQTGRTQVVESALSRLRTADPLSRIEVMGDGRLRLNGQIDIDAARISDIGAGRRAAPPTGRQVGTPTPADQGTQDLQTLMQGTRELDARGGDIARLRREQPALARALENLASSSAYRLRFPFHRVLAAEFAAGLTLDAPRRARLDALVRGADDEELSRLYDIPNEGTPRGAARQQETRSTFASWALDQNPADLHEFVAQYQFIRAEFVRRGKSLEKQVEELMAREHLSLEAARQRLGFGGRGQPPNVDEMVWRGLTDPAELARMGPRWRSQLFMVAGKTGSVPLPRGSAQPSPVPASDAETIAAVRTIDRIPMPDEVTAAYHTHKHHHELPPTEQFNAASPRAGVSNEFDAYMKAAMETVHNPATTTVAATQDGTGRVITFTRQVRWPDGRTATSRALVLVSFDGRVTLLTYIPGA